MRPLSMLDVHISTSLHSAFHTSDFFENQIGHDVISYYSREIGKDDCEHDARELY